nr:unnamed protein product [Callosobruchus chinensis]
MLKHLAVLRKSPKDLRGQSTSGNKLGEDIQLDVRHHIESFPVKLSHYANRDIKYLHSELNLNIMYDLFKQKYPTLKVSYSYYTRYFRENFSLRFGRPQVDFCAACETLNNKIKNQHLNEVAKRTAEAELMVHKRRTKKFYTKLKSESELVPGDADNILALSFDYMQNIQLPKTPVAEVSNLRYQGVLYLRLSQIRHPNQMPKKHKNWDPLAMVKAVKAVRNKEMGYLKASTFFNLPKGTVERYSKSDKSPEELVKLSIGRKPVFSKELENDLVKYALAMEQRFYGLRSGDMKRMAFQLAFRNKIPHPFNGVSKSAGKKWLRLFLKRHPQLSMRTPQGMSAARVKSFTPEKVSGFFDLYEPEYNKIQNPSQRVFNVDETGITIVQHKHSKVISLKGKKQISTLTSAERGKLITIITCMNASGVYIPPVLIFPRKNMKAFAKPTATDPVLLVLDGHFSHTRNIELIDSPASFNQ